MLLRPEEIERIRSLPWPDSDRALVQDFWHSINGFPYFRRQANGACIFLTDAGICLMHQRFGFDCKALTCRGYPHNIATTWPGEVSVVARLDCPAVQRGEGEPLTANRRQIEALVAELGAGKGFTSRQLQGLNRPAVTQLTEALVSLVEPARDDGLSPGRRAYALALAGERFRALGATFLNDRSTLTEVMPSLLRGVLDEARDATPGYLGPFARLLFREWLAAYCRRDEELVSTGLGVRLRRTAALAGYALGVGSLRRIGAEHPAVSLRRVGLFAGRRGREASSHDAWAAYRQLIVARLEGLQFFGVTYYDEAFFVGLRALLQSYALVLAAARCQAVSRGSALIAAGDVQYAVGAIDHCLGRSPLLQWPSWRRLEEYFAGPRYGRVLQSLGWE